MPDTKPQTGNSHVPPYQAPHIIATYSHLKDRSIANNDASMSYYRGSAVGDDLKIGYEKMVERDPLLEEHLDGVCQALLKFRREGGMLKDRALITWRGMLTRLLVAAYTDRDSWEMNAVAFDGNVYLEDHFTRKARQKRLEDEQSYKLQSYFGYSYEAFATSSDNAAPVEKSKKKREANIAVNTNVQWCCVVKSKIGNVRLYMGGEVDCVEGEWKKDMKQCVELKTNMILASGRQRINFEKKLMKHWAQSWLLGVPKIVVGFRDAQGMLIQNETFYTDQIPEMIYRTPQASWEANTCLQCFASLSERILEEVLPTDPTPVWRSEGGDMSRIPEPTVWRIVFQPGKGLTFKRLGARVPEAQDDMSTERWAFLPLNFVKETLAL